MAKKLAPNKNGQAASIQQINQSSEAAGQFKVNKGLDEVPKSEALDEKHGDSDEAPRDSENADDNEEDAEETAFEEVKL